MAVALCPIGPTPAYSFATVLAAHSCESGAFLGAVAHHESR